MEKITITTTSFAKYDRGPVLILEKNGFKVVANPFGRKLSKEETVELCKGSRGIIAGTEAYDEDMLKKLNSLSVISRCGAGTQNVDIRAAEKSGIRVFNTPDAPTLAVAELTVGLILNLLRKISRMDADMKAGRWDKKMGNLLSGKQVGIIGIGRIGSAVKKILSSFDCNTSFSDKVDRVKGERAAPMPLDEILKSSDIISLHVSGNETVIGEKEIALMKKGAHLINTSRGSVVDEKALYRALKEKHLSGAAIDVFEKEPYDGSLKELDNVILTPHIGSYAKEARIKMELEAVNNLLVGLDK